MEDQKKVKRTGKRIVLDILFAALIVFLIAASFFEFSQRVRNSVHSNAEQTLHDMNHESALLLETQIKRDFEFLHSLAAIMVEDDSIDNKDMITRNLRLGCENYSFDRMTYIQPDGMAYTSTGAEQDLSGREYYKKALEGQDAVSGIIVSAHTGKEGFAVLACMALNVLIAWVLYKKNIIKMIPKSPAQGKSEMEELAEDMDAE